MIYHLTLWLAPNGLTRTSCRWRWCTASLSGQRSMDAIPTAFQRYHAPHLRGLAPQLKGLKPCMRLFGFWVPARDSCELWGGFRVVWLNFCLLTGSAALRPIAMAIPLRRDNLYTSFLGGLDDSAGILQWLRSYLWYEIRACRGILYYRFLQLGCKEWKTEFFRCSWLVSNKCSSAPSIIRATAPVDTGLRRIHLVLSLDSSVTIFGVTLTSGMFRFYEQDPSCQINSGKSVSTGNVGLIRAIKVCTLPAQQTCNMVVSSVRVPQGRGFSCHWETCLEKTNEAEMFLIQQSSQHEVAALPVLCL